MNYSDLKQEYRLQSDSYDKWGSAMNALFDVSAELWWRGEFIPWDYSPGATDDPREPNSYMAEVSADTDTDALLAFGRVLDRYTDQLRRADLDY